MVTLLLTQRVQEAAHHHCNLNQFYPILFFLCFIECCTGLHELTETKSCVIVLSSGSVSISILALSSSVLHKCSHCLRSSLLSSCAACTTMSCPFLFAVALSCTAAFLRLLFFVFRLSHGLFLQFFSRSSTFIFHQCFAVHSVNLHSFFSWTEFLCIIIAEVTESTLRFTVHSS